MRKLRRIASWIHLYGGLLLGGLLIVISVTGSLLVFKDPIDRWLRPDLRTAAPTGEHASLDRMLEAVRDTAPDATPWIVEMPADETGTVTVWLGADAPRVYVDPYRDTVLGTRGATEGVMNTLSALHIDLLAGTVGHVIVGVIGLLLVLLTATGLVLWWPRRLRALGAALRVGWRHGAPRFNYDLHRAGGFYTTVFLLLTALTGSAFVFYPTTQSLVGTLTGSAPWPPPAPTVEVPADSSRAPGAIAYEAALQATRNRLPDADVSFVYVPQSPTEPVTVRLRTPAEWHPNGRSFAYADPSDGTLLRVDDARRAPLGARLLHTFYPLHVGAVGGRLGAWLYGILGLAPAVLSVTGTIIWYRRRRRRVRERPDSDAVGTRPVELPSQWQGSDETQEAEAARPEADV
jgi:uncharacterized iron-regulated membrane protein